jgi:DNA-damage-inducible protein J
MAASAVVTAEIDAKLEREASEVLADIGLTTSDILRMALEKVVRDKGLPHVSHVPNSETIATLEEADRGEGMRYRTTEAMFEDLGL